MTQRMPGSGIRSVLPVVSRISSRDESEAFENSRRIERWEETYGACRWQVAIVTGG
jgi:hypothetical protein